MKTLIYTLVAVALLVVSSPSFSYDPYYRSLTLNERIAERKARQQYQYSRQQQYYHVESQSSRYAPETQSSRYAPETHRPDTSSRGYDYEHEVGGLAGRPNSWEY